MSEIKVLAESIKSRFGTVKRARGYFLYTEKRVRLTDMYLEGGRAVLGWGSDFSGVWTVFKNLISRGLTGSFITDFNAASKVSGTSRLSRAVSALLNDQRVAVICSSKEDALKKSLAVSKDGTFVYRPWGVQGLNLQKADCVLIAPPLAWAQNLWILALKQEVALENAGKTENSGNTENVVDSSLFIPAALEGALTRSLYDLIKALQVREEKDWFKYDKVLGKYWTRQGPWLFPKVPEEKYSEFVQHCLDCQLVVSPFYSVPSLVPYGADSGVFKMLEKAPFLWSE